MCRKIRVCYTPKKRMRLFYYIILYFFFSCYDREKRLDVWGNFRGRLAHAKTHFITVFLLHFLHLCTYFSFVCFLDSAVLDFSLGWGAHSQLTVLSRGPKSLLHTFCSWELLLFSFSFLLNILPSFSWAFSFLFF